MTTPEKPCPAWCDPEACDRSEPDAVFHSSTPIEVSTSTGQTELMLVRTDESDDSELAFVATATELCLYSTTSLTGTVEAVEVHFDTDTQLPELIAGLSTKLRMARSPEEETPALRQSDQYAAMAAHLRRFPELKPASLDPTGCLHVWCADATSMAQWFRSVSARELRVRLVLDRGYASVHAYDVEINGLRFADLWGTVDGLERLLIEGGDSFGRGLPLTVDELTHYAEYDVLPDPGAYLAACGGSR